MSNDSANPFPKIAIIILNWNGKKDTIECLHSVSKISYPNFATIVVDNGSKDDSVVEIRREFPEAQLIETNQNLGFAEGNNVGIREALSQGAEGILLLNNDTIVDPRMLHAFAESLKAFPKAGIFGGKLHLYSQRDLLDHLGGMWNQKKGCFDFVGLKQNADDPEWQKPLALDYVCGAAFFVKKEVFLRIGLLEPKFFLIWEESDFCFRARKEGFLSMTCPEANIWHKVSASFVGKAHTTYFWWRNRLLFVQRNLPCSKRISFYIRTLIPEIFHIWKLAILKRMQLSLLKLVSPKKEQTTREKKLLQYQAALKGVADFLFNRFGNGPSWIYSPSEIKPFSSRFKKKLSSKSSN